MWKTGEFDPITPLFRLKETKSLIEALEVFNCKLASDHITNYLWSSVNGLIYQGVDGKLPEDKESILQILEKTITKIKERDNIFDANALLQRGILTNL
jgi:hypothetical protein